jgi:hypothetical protein
LGRGAAAKSGSQQQAIQSNHGFEHDHTCISKALAAAAKGLAADALGEHCLLLF